MPANPVEYVVLTNRSFVGIRKIEMIDHKIWLIQCQKRTISAVFCTCSMSQYHYIKFDDRGTFSSPREREISFLFYVKRYFDFSFGVNA